MRRNVADGLDQGGDLRNPGGKGPGEMTFLCPDGAVLFKITGEQMSESRESRSKQNKAGANTANSG